MALHIGVIGEGRCSRRIAVQAERVGAAIAAAGAVLVCGGLGGVMAAASRGAARSGGVVVGLLPGVDPADANRWVTIPIATGMDQARNVIVVRSSDAVIAIGGMYGTLSEIALALKARKPLVLLGSWQFEMEGVSPTVPRARDAAHAVELAFAALGTAEG